MYAATMQVHMFVFLLYSRLYTVSLNEVINTEANYCL